MKTKPVIAALLLLVGCATAPRRSDYVSKCRSKLEPLIGREKYPASILYEAIYNESDNGAYDGVEYDGRNLTLENVMASCQVIANQQYGNAAAQHQAGREAMAEAFRGAGDSFKDYGKPTGTALKYLPQRSTTKCKNSMYSGVECKTTGY